MGTHTIFTGTGRILRGLSRSEAVARLQECQNAGDMFASVWPSEDARAIEAEAGYRGATPMQCRQSLEGLKHNS